MPTTIKFNHSNYAYDKFCVNRIEIPFEITLRSRFKIRNFKNFLRSPDTRASREENQAISPSILTPS